MLKRILHKKLNGQHFVSIFTISVILISTMSGQSQNERFNFGFYTNVTHSKWRGEMDKFCQSLTNDIESLDNFSDFVYDVIPRVGANVGFIFNIRLDKGIYAQTELSYMMKGTTINGVGTAEFSWYKTAFHDVYMKENYIEIPLLLKIYVASREKDFNRPRGFNMYFIIGPSIGFVVNRDMETVVQIGDEISTDVHEFDGLTKTDFGLDFGVGFEIVKYLDLEFRYQKGLSSVITDEYLHGSKITNGVFTWGFGCTFPIK